ncbi:MAG: hypothetical protein SFT90_04865 [Rickettsiales bacterium]|nr:hypothetical protein [Rickettsiales bacterium]
MAKDNNNNDDDFKGKKSPEIEVDPVTGKITIKQSNNSSDVEANAEIGDDKKSNSQQSRKKMIEPHHSPDDKAIEAQSELDKKLQFLHAMSQRLSNARPNNKDVYVTKNIGDKLQKIGVKFLGHIAASRMNNVSPSIQVGSKSNDKDIDLER